MSDLYNAFNPDPWVRPNIRTLSPYHAARDDFNEGLLLDANENALGPVTADPRPLHRYPDTRMPELRKLWASFRGVSAEQVFTGVGSDEAIDLLIRVFCEPGRDEILITPPTYGMYKVAARINNITVSESQLDKEFQLDAQRVLSRVTHHTKLIILCSPNNPTGNRLETGEIEKILQGFRRLVVVDEAYADFSEQGSLSELLHTYPNLVLLQTLSKSFGLAAIRLGAALAHEQVIGWMMKVKAPYNMNRLTADVGMQALSDLTSMHRHVALIRQEREKLAEALAALPGVEKVFASEANFVLVRLPDALKRYEQLAGRGIIVRYRGEELHCEQTLRITVGTPEENKRLIAELSSLLASDSTHSGEPVH